MTADALIGGVFTLPKTAKPMKFHPIANVPPLMDDERLQALADDIRNNGLLDPITVFEGMILDGRNRLAACHIAGVEPKAAEFSGTRVEAVQFCRSKNERRDLTSSQRAAIDAKYAKLIEEYAEQVEQMKAEAAARKAQSKGKPRGEKQSVSSGNNSGTDDNETRTKRAKAAGTNPKYIDEADKLAADWPQLLQKVECGDLSIPEAKTMRAHLESVPEVERDRVWSMVSQPATPAKEATRMLSNLASMSESSRESVLSDFESGDEKRASAAVCCAAAMPPMPDPRSNINEIILSNIAKAVKLGDEAEYTTARKAIESLQERFRKEFDSEAENNQRRRNGR